MSQLTATKTHVKTQMRRIGSLVRVSPVNALVYVQQLYALQVQSNSVDRVCVHISNCSMIRSLCTSIIGYKAHWRASKNHWS